MEKEKHNGEDQTRRREDICRNTGAWSQRKRDTVLESRRIAEETYNELNSVKRKHPIVSPPAFELHSGKRTSPQMDDTTNLFAILQGQPLHNT